jgi:hypothetical protein
VLEQAGRLHEKPGGGEKVVASRQA